MPAKPEFIDRLSTITDFGWSTFRMGIRWIGDDGSLRAAGLVTSFAPITRVTSVAYTAEYGAEAPPGSEHQIR